MMTHFAPEDLAKTVRGTLTPDAPLAKHVGSRAVAMPIGCSSLPILKT